VSETAALLERLRALQRAGALELPLPAAGASAQRHRALYAFGREDLSLARLAEAHTDALAILAQAGSSPAPGCLYGVWASDGPNSHLSLQRAADGTLRLQGRKQYCSGAPFLDAALVSAHEGDSLWLLELPLRAPGIRIESAGWASPAFAATQTRSVCFDQVPLPAAAIVGTDRWYLQRSGFWHGAIGPAACWAGGAAGLIDAAVRLQRRDAHARAHLGALEAAGWAMRSLLDQAGEQMDAAPDDRPEAQRRALIVRHLIERLCSEVMDRFGRLSGPQLLAFDAAIALRHAELTLYLRQCHAERDLEAIVEASAPPAAAITARAEISARPHTAAEYELSGADSAKDF
jgi:alkylation response protein AidB-like acyl-CoA dehydrogenase